MLVFWISVGSGMGFVGCWWSLLFWVVFREVKLWILSDWSFGWIDFWCIVIDGNVWVVRLWKLFCLFVFVGCRLFLWLWSFC